MSAELIHRGELVNTGQLQEILFPPLSDREIQERHQQSIRVFLTDGVDVRKYRQHQFESEIFNGRTIKRNSPKGCTIPNGIITSIPSGIYTITECRRWISQDNNREVLMFRLGNYGWWVRVEGYEDSQSSVDEIFQTQHDDVSVSSFYRLDLPARPEPTSSLNR